MNLQICSRSSNSRKVLQENLPKSCKILQEKSCKTFQDFYSRSNKKCYHPFFSLSHQVLALDQQNILPSISSPPPSLSLSLSCAGVFFAGSVYVDVRLFLFVKQFHSTYIPRVCISTHKVKQNAFLSSLQ